MVIFVAKENGDRRVAVTPEAAKKYVDSGGSVVIESGAGEEAGYSDSSYEAAGAVVSTEKGVAGADIVISINPLDEKMVKQLSKGTIVISTQEPHANPNNIKLFLKHGITTFALEFIPRTTRAQYMDILSSQACLAGYKAVIEAAHYFDRGLPLLITSAGTIPAAKILVVGAGVAGLQAIATARRLGAIVSAFDVRADAKEQVESLGAKFVDVNSSEATNGVYATEMSEVYKRAQEDKLREVLPGQDIVITTAQIPGKKAPIVIKSDMVKLMKHGSIIIDLASKTGGNCECTVQGQITDINGVKVMAFDNILNLIAADASRLFSKNVSAFLDLLLQEMKNCNSDIAAISNDIIKETLLTYDGVPVSSRLQMSE
ncbi:MAG: NAD(P) transhydrogenase subunit alpha [Holosporales bacterium]|nr:NAD(P) transhydrogenase subunit alpha [Holosporales bacterium]